MDYRITHACGHEQDHYIPGFAQQRERKLRWLRSTACRPCYMAGKSAEEAEVAARDGAAIATLTLADLVGSDQQIAWATSIRARRLAMLITMGIADLARHPCLAISEATWWIGRRDLGDSELLASR